MDDDADSDDDNDAMRSLMLLTSTGSVQQRQQEHTEHRGRHIHRWRRVFLTGEKPGMSPGCQE
ncbi:hypothetical protein MGYG_03127 [Nannizzia gypsea CBS 118893]|uniref:Uncharacterized protein n=1 Tax=Arthroderma gypseum (strain ATCC MYA-4604 / CBS 118893) TaxID=535722 RepID=E4UR06_ARTGP|nr:hypothetical protein MGYG_03127 [Nannizzia gypsea CBS 118893]EFR00121.1 hypothetical protein MGYG_03127 [Nannizzia gypsea CBS 118893]